VTRRLLVTLGLLLPLAAALAVSVALRPRGPSLQRVPTREGPVTVNYVDNLPLAYFNLPALPGGKVLRIYRYEARDAKGRLITSLARASLLANGTPAALAARLVAACKGASATDKQGVTIWWGKKEDVLRVRLTPAGPARSALTVERAVRARKAPKVDAPRVPRPPDAT